MLHGGQEPARAGPGTQYFSVGDESVPEPVGEPQVQARVQRHFMEDMGYVCLFVQILDLPVPQMVDTVLEFFRLLDLASCRAGYRSTQGLLVIGRWSKCRRFCPVPPPQRTVAPIIDFPVPGPRPSRGFLPRQGLQRTVEQIIDIPVSRTRDDGGLPGFHHEKSSTARGGAHDAWLRRGAGDLEARLEAELEELLAISAVSGLSPHQQGRLDEVHREIARL